MDRALLDAGLAPPTEGWHGHGRPAEVLNDWARRRARRIHACGGLMARRGQRARKPVDDRGPVNQPRGRCDPGAPGRLPVPDGTWPKVAAQLGRTTRAARVRAYNLLSATGYQAQSVVYVVASFELLTRKCLLNPHLPGEIERRGWDSNPRPGFPRVRDFQSRSLGQLGHLSARAGKSNLSPEPPQDG